MPMLIKRGHAGSHVMDIQNRLNLDAQYGISRYPHLVPDGKFGPRTDERVREWQMMNGLKVDGIVGPNTWTKMFGGAMPPTVGAGPHPPAAPTAGAAGASPPGPPTTGYLYVLDGPSYPGAAATGNYPKRSAHPTSQCHYVIVNPPADAAQKMGQEMGDLAKNKNLRVAELIINGHSSGAGMLSIGGLRFNLGDNAQALFRYVKPYLAGDCIIWIFACSFATATPQKLDSDHDVITPGELMNGEGTKAMLKIAQATGCEVRAGFSWQTPNFEHFSSAWCSVTPGGQVKRFIKGREVPWQERLGRIGEGAEAIVNSMYNWMFG